MQPLPHAYKVTSISPAEANVTLFSGALSELEIAPPPEFGGPENLWSPETCLVGAVASCYALSFKSLARGSALQWNRLDCEVNGILDKANGKTRFTDMAIAAHLTVSAQEDVDMASKLLERAEQFCLITNSLTSEIHLEINVRVEEGMAV